MNKSKAIFLPSIIAALLLVIVAFAAICFKRDPIERRLPSNTVFNVLFWTSIFALLFCHFFLEFGIII